MSLKGLIIALSSMVLVVAINLFLGCQQNQPTASQIAEEYAITQLRNGIIGNGVNLQPSYYNSGCVNFAWPLMEGISTVRIEIEPDRVLEAKSWIREATNNGKNIIATYHESDVLGTDDANELIAAANWWKSYYSFLSEAGSFTINLMNEWGSHDQTASSFASAYNDAISIVRQVYSGTIIIDIPGWGQETHTAADASSMINDGDIMFSVHIYKGAWNSATGEYLVNSDLDYLGDAGRPCIVGEFGSGMTGEADWSSLVDHAKSKGWPIIAWSWNGCGTEMNMVSPSWNGNATATSFSTNSYFTQMCNKIGNCGGGGSVSGSGNCCTNSGDECGTCEGYNTYRFCCLPELSDPDGDGWGWEYGDNCVVEGSQVAIDQNCGGGTTTAGTTTTTTTAATTSTTTTAATTTTTAAGNCDCGTCRWYGSNVPACCTQTTGWGWQDGGCNRTCVGCETCINAGQTCTNCTQCGGATTTTTTAATTSTTTTAATTSTTTTAATTSTTTTAATTTTTAAAGCTCDAGCDSRTTISVPFTQNGAGEYCWEVTSLGSYINSWNLDVLEINGVDYTNKWSNSFPEKIDGVYYIYYKGSYGWSHFEAR